MVNFNSKIFVAGHKGLVGSAIVRQLKKKGYSKILTIDKKKLDLTDQSKVHKFLKKNKPSFIFKRTFCIVPKFWFYRMYIRFFPF